MAMSGQTMASDTISPAEKSVHSTVVQMRALQQSLDAVERGDIAAALGHIDRLMEDESSTHVHTSARLLRGQISGAFKARQVFWLKRKVADVVVLVPNEAACLAAMQQWTDDCFWPVLIEDGWFTPMFVSAFSPKQIWRWSSRSAPSTTRLDKALLDTIKTHNQAQANNRQKRPRPPGLVVIDPYSSQRLGGLALALGRRQPISLMCHEGRIRTILSSTEAVALNARLLKVASYWQLPSNDTWFGLTIAGPLPYRYRAPVVNQDNQSPKVPLPANLTLRAVDDLLGRPESIGGDSGMRNAVVGRLTGLSVQVVYQAMCSLFIQPKRTLWVDAYSTRRGAIWSSYSMDRAVELMRQRFACELMTASTIGIQQFRKRTRPINHYDMIWINSSGGAKTWQFGGRSNSNDFPIGYPTAMHVIHSHSLANAWDVNTLAGRALAGGAYWYFGAMAEPYLIAFNQPTGMACKILAGTPVAFAARLLPGQHGASPWRLMLVGDPLFTLTESLRPRLQIEAIESATRVVRPDDTAPPAPRLCDTLLVNGHVAKELALACLDKPHALEADDLIRTVSVLYRHGAFDTLSLIPDELLTRHRMASVLVHLSRLTSGNTDTQE